ELVAAVFSTGVVEDLQQRFQLLLAGQLVEQEPLVQPVERVAYGRLAWSVCADDLLAQPLQGLHWLHLQAGEADARALLHPMRNAVVQDLRFAGTARARPDGDFGRTEHEFVAELSVGRRVAEVRARLRIEKRNYAVSEMGRPAKAIRVQMLRAVDSLRDAGLRDSGHQ